MNNSKRYRKADAPAVAIPRHHRRVAFDAAGFAMTLDPTVQSGIAKVMEARLARTKGAPTSLMGGYERPRLLPNPSKPGVESRHNAKPANAVASAVPAAALESKKASEFSMRAVCWIWPDRFALGKLGLIAGLPDKGKRLISADMIARCTTGSDWPCNEGKAPRGNVIWWPPLGSRCRGEVWSSDPPNPPDQWSYTP
jgi:hypothetical protein